MQLIQWTLFIDMLGYRDVNGSIVSDDSANEFISFMQGNRKVLELTDNPQIKESYKQNATFNLYQYYDIAHCFVSDSIIITYKPRENPELLIPRLRYLHSANALFIIAMRLQTLIFKCFQEKGIFLRGGISNKYCQIKDNFAVGEGLMEAYQAESTIAKYPRIVLHPNSVEEELLAEIRYIGQEMYAGNGALQQDPNDALWFIDNIGYAIATAQKKVFMGKASASVDENWYDTHLIVVQNYINSHALQIEKKLDELEKKLRNLGPDDKTRNGLESVIQKFVWLKKYHNSKISTNPWLKGRLIP